MNKLLLITGFTLAFLISASTLNAQNEKNIIVTVKYKTQPSREAQALSALKLLIDQVKKESYYVKIVIHADPSDKTNILLYEEWSSEDYYKGEHMQTPHLKKFIDDSKEFLAGPPEITFWKVLK